MFEALLCAAESSFPQNFVLAARFTVRPTSATTKSLEIPTGTGPGSVTPAQVQKRL